MIPIWHKSAVATYAASKQSPADMVIVLNAPKRATISISFSNGVLYVLEHTQIDGLVTRCQAYIDASGDSQNLSEELYALLKVWMVSLKDSVRLEDYLKINNVL